MDSIIAWMVALIVSVAPVGARPATPEGKETQAETYERYNEIAQDLVTVVYDEKELPLFKGPQGRAKTALLLLAIAKYESSFRKDVDYGLGDKGRGDGGQSWCLGQIKLGHPTKEGSTPQRIGVNERGFWTWDKEAGFSGQDLVNDRQKCFRAMLWMVRTSFAVCGKLYKDQPQYFLNLYASGKCVPKTLKGYEASERRMNLYKKWVDGRKTRPPLDVHDTDVMASMVHVVRASPPPPVPDVAVLASIDEWWRLRTPYVATR